MREIIVRPELPGEEDIVRAIVAAAFGEAGVENLLDALRLSPAWRGLSFVAETQGDLVAHVCYTRGWVDAPKELIEVLILSPMSVHPNWQRQGIGSQLIAESLQMLADRPEPVVFLEGNPAFYRKVGFKPATEAGFIAPSVRIPSPAFQFCPLPNYQPALNGALVYPDVFWATDSVGLRR